MHPIQKKILELSKTEDVLNLGIRPLGRRIGEDKPQIVKHHLNQLQKKGLLSLKSREDIKLFLDKSASMQPDFVQIPVVGAANCGPATIIAEGRVDEEYLLVSQSLLKKRGNIFALVAKGDSMNKANIYDKSIEENDYVVIDSDQRIPNKGDYILSIINGCSNIKKYNRSVDGNIALLSESDKKYAPIYISEHDEFIVNGKVIQVIKAVRQESG